MHYFVRARALGTLKENDDYVVLSFHGSRGGLVATLFISPEVARQLAVDLLDAAAAFHRES
jgi:hypothetical protein